MARVARVGSISAFCRGMTPAQRWTWLKSDEAKRNFPAHLIHQELAALNKRDRAFRNVVCSASWKDAAWNGEEFPPGRDETAMVQSTVPTAWGEGKQTRRWMPAQNQPQEDYIDGLGRQETHREMVHWEGSPSAIAIHRHATYAKAGLRRLADDRGRIGRGRANTGTKRNAE